MAAPTPGGEGLVVAGKFLAVVIEDMDNDGNLDVVGGASSPGIINELLIKGSPKHSMIAKAI